MKKLVARYLNPRPVVAIDRNRAAVRFCNRYLRAESLLFRVGNAELLPFLDAPFDAVLNTESSHGYGLMERFLVEVMRVLRPGGVLLLADFRTSADIVRLRRQSGSARASPEALRETSHRRRAGEGVTLMPNPLHSRLASELGLTSVVFIEKGSSAALVGPVVGIARPGMILISGHPTPTLPPGEGNAQ